MDEIALDTTGPSPATGTPARTADRRVLRDAIRAMRPRADHPTRRPDGRTPNPRCAATALAAAMNAPVEALELLDTPDRPGR